MYFKQPLDFFLEFIPQLIFMSSLFGYMIIMIFIKWSTNWDGREASAPSIISQLMNIFLDFGNVDGKPLWGDDNTQQNFHFFLLILALILVPIMLFPKPIIIYLRNKNQYQVNHPDEPIVNILLKVLRIWIFLKK